MAITDSESFGFSSSFQDYVTYANWVLLAGSYSNEQIVSGNNPFGGNSVQVQSSHAIAKSLPTGNTTNLMFGFYFKVLSNGQYGAVVFSDSSNNCQVYIGLNGTNGQISVVTGAANVGVDSNLSGGTTLGTTAASSFTANTWNFLEVAIIFATASGGSVSVNLNGGNVLNLTSVTTQVSGITGVNFFVFKGPANGNAGYNYYSNIYVGDTTGSAPWNAFLGEVKVAAFNPTANDAVQFTPNGNANNYQNAAEYPPVPGTDFNQTATVNNQDSFTHGSLSGVVKSVYAVVTKSFMIDPSGSHTMANVLLSSTSTAQGITNTPSTVGKVYTDVFETDPATSVQWVTAGANACRNGYKLLS